MKDVDRIAVLASALAATIGALEVALKEHGKSVLFSSAALWTIERTISEARAVYAREVER
jgi:hypothetical protein